MNPECARFRSELEELHGTAAGRARLAHDEHARVCRACRAELARASGLERLLASVPAPEVPSGLARRVLAGLAPSRLGRNPEVAVPELTSPEDREPDEGVLEELLESIPRPVAPAGLSERVLRGLAPARVAPSNRRLRAPWLWVAAAGVLAAIALWVGSRWRSEPEPAELVLEPEELEADEELLAYAVERWELLHDDDLDVWLASVDPVLVEPVLDEDGEPLEGFADRNWFRDDSIENDTFEADTFEGDTFEGDTELAPREGD